MLHLARPVEFIQFLVRFLEPVEQQCQLGSFPRASSIALTLEYSEYQEQCSR